MNNIYCSVVSSACRVWQQRMYTRLGDALIMPLAVSLRTPLRRQLDVHPDGDLGVELLTTYLEKQPSE